MDTRTNKDEDRKTWMQMIFSALVLITLFSWLMLMTMWMAILS